MALAYLQSLATAYNLPFVLVLLAPIFLLIVLIFLLYFVWKIFEPRYKLYVSDLFYGVIWRWSWQGDSVVDLWCFCSTCKQMLFVDDENCKTTTKLHEKNTFFVCKTCGQKEVGRIKGGDRRYALNMIKRDIAAKVRHKTFDIYTKR
ncbi:MAG: hypothetical protein IBX44_07480 [Sulfurospirillum sp.]|nr:hypothetical protein [Sulfurospirillum sp.]